jgi:hypothetical protein
LKTATSIKRPNLGSALYQQFICFSLYQKFFFHAVRIDTISGLSTMTSFALRGVFCGPTMTMAGIGATLVAPINPYDLQFSRGPS